LLLLKIHWAYIPINTFSNYASKQSLEPPLGLSLPFGNTKGLSGNVLQSITRSLSSTAWITLPPCVDRVKLLGAVLGSGVLTVLTFLITCSSLKLGFSCLLLEEVTLCFTNATGHA